MAVQTQLSVEVEADLKKEVEKISANIGLNASDVIKVFLKKFVDRRGFPFEVIEEDCDYNPSYNKETIRAMEEVKNGNSGREVTMEEFENLLSKTK